MYSHKIGSNSKKLHLASAAPPDPELFIIKRILAITQYTYSGTIYRKSFATKPSQIQYTQWFPDARGKRKIPMTPEMF